MGSLFYLVDVLHFSLYLIHVLEPFIQLVRAISIVNKQSRQMFDGDILWQLAHKVIQSEQVTIVFPQTPEMVELHEEFLHGETVAPVDVD